MRYAKISIIYFFTLIFIIQSVFAISSVQHSIEGNKVTLTYQGTPPFWINIRGDANLGQVGGYLWAKTYSNSFSYDMSFAINPSKKFHYGVKDTWWSNTNTFSLGQTNESFCKELIAGHNIANANRANIIFVGFGYNNSVSPSGDVIKQIAEYAIDWNGEKFGLFSVSPFKNNRNKFNIWYINKSLPLSYCSSTGSWDAYGHCTDVEELLAQCPQSSKYIFFLGNSLFRSTGGNPAQLSMIYRKDMWCKDINKCQNLRDISIMHNPCITQNSYRYQHDPTLAQDVNFDGTINDLDLLFSINCPFIESQGCTGQSYPLIKCDDKSIKFDLHADRLFVHEFGHQFGNLRDESIGSLGDQALDPSTNTNTNCISFTNIEDCRMNAPWKNLIGNGCGMEGLIDCTNPDGSHKLNWTAEIDCYEGCKFSGTYRSIYEGIMNKLYSDPYVFGLYNEQLIKNKIDTFTGK